MNDRDGTSAVTLDGSGWPYEPTGTKAPTREELQQRPMACSLPAVDIEQRIARLRSDFIPKIARVEEIRDGYVYWFDRSAENLREISEFALFESECCDFLDFGIGLNTSGDRISLRITGPLGAANFLQLVMKGDVPPSGSCSGC